MTRDAEVMVLGRHGYETAIKGKNAFVCMVERSWTALIDDPDFWNPKLRAPICFNAAAAHSYLPRTIKKTELILAGRTKAQMSSRNGHWHPHLMFFFSSTDLGARGAGLPGSPKQTPSQRVCQYAQRAGRTFNVRNRGKASVRPADRSWGRRNIS